MEIFSLWYVLVAWNYEILLTSKFSTCVIPFLASVMIGNASDTYEKQPSDGMDFQTIATRMD
jgi:hypothetical protein